MRDAMQFHELRGDYDEAQKGQVFEPNDYLDYFEPLGSALARLPDGAGGPFVHQFTRSGGRLISAIGWVVSAASKRAGGWRLWGMWTDRPIPPLTVAAVWPDLPDPRRRPDPTRRLEVALDDDVLADRVKKELARAYANRDARVEVEVDPSSLDVLLWLYLLGPVDPAAARLQPNRFTGAGYQYILTDSPRTPNERVPRDIARMVDIAATDPVGAINLAAELRARATKPASTKTKRPTEVHDMPTRTTTPVSRSDIRAVAPLAWRVVRDLAVIALLAWIAVEVRQIRKSLPLSQPAPAVSSTAEPEAAAPTPPTPTREERIVQSLTAEGIRVAAGESKLPQIAVEILLRRNRCFTGTAAVDGALSAAEQRAMRNCTALREARLVKANGDLDADRAVGWLEGNL